MEKHLVTEPALLTIQIDLRTNLVLKLLIRRISDIIGEVGELVPWFRDNDKGGDNNCAMVRVLAPGGTDQSHAYPTRWIMGWSRRGKNSPVVD